MTPNYLLEQKLSVFHMRSINLYLSLWLLVYKVSSSKNNSILHPFWLECKTELLVYAEDIHSDTQTFPAMSPVIIPG